MDNPEILARQKIDECLIKSGWVIQTIKNLNLHGALGVAVCEFPLLNGLEADYLLFINTRAVGIIEAKRAEVTLTGVENQSKIYSENLTNHVKYYQLPLPFVYESNGSEIQFTDLRDNKCRSRSIFAFHQPKTLLDMVGDDTTLRNRLKNFPRLDKDNLRDCQFDAINRLEYSFANNNQRSLITMATGAGKTYTACNFVYRLLKHGKAKRILFLVDRNNLGLQAHKEFSSFRVENMNFTEVYITQHLSSNQIDPDAKVVITTIQRLYSILSGEVECLMDEEHSAYEVAGNFIKEVVYNNDIPPEFFDFIITDECHRSIYGEWRSVLNYFDAFIVGLTATPTKHTLGYFNENMVSDYNYERSVEDGVNVGFTVMRLRTDVSENGGKIEKLYPTPVMDKLTRKTKLEILDDDIEYKPTELDRKVTVPNQIRTVLEVYKNTLFTELFPERTPDWVPKTLIFAKDDNHAEIITKITREVFGEGNEFCKKITYNISGEKAETLINEFRTSPKLRIAVTVDMIATGTDIKALEVLIFMRNVSSRVYYEQMKGRGARSIPLADLQSVTPNATGKNVFYLIDAVGVTESYKTESMVNIEERKLEKSVPFSKLLDQVAQGRNDKECVKDLSNRLKRLNTKLNDAEKIEAVNISGKDILQITNELDNTQNEDEVDEALKVFSNPDFRGFLTTANGRYKLYFDDLTIDRVISFERSHEQAKGLVGDFKEFIEINKNEIEALSLIYSNKSLNYAALKDLEFKLISHNPAMNGANLWAAYQALDNQKVRRSVTGKLTNLIQLVRYAIGYDETLKDFESVTSFRYELWLGRMKKRGLDFNQEQRQWLAYIKEVIVNNAMLNLTELNDMLEDRGGVVRCNKVFEDFNTLYAELSEALLVA